MGVSRKPFRILSLDGGGTFALIQARALADLYPNQNGHEVLSHFDLAVGCSGGSIVLAALIEGLSPQQIFQLFDKQDNRESLFHALPFWRSKLDHFTRFFHVSPVGQRFSTQDKLAFLNRVLPNYGGVPLHDVSQKLSATRHAFQANRGEKLTELAVMIVTYDYDRDRARMLRSNWNINAASLPKHSQHGITLADAAHASSTAPLKWFDSPAQFAHGRFWDGALTGYNNPALAGVSEAIAMGYSGKDIGVLSIGTSSVSLPLKPGNFDPRLVKPFPKTNLVTTVTKVGEAIINDPPDAQSYVAHLMTGGRVPTKAAECPLTDTAVVRMSPLIQPVIGAGGQLEPPRNWSVEDFLHLTKLDIATVEDGDVAFIKRMADGWIAGEWNNQPIRHGGDYPPLAPATFDQYWEIGHSTYARAKQAWGPT